jgi:hypothetical protein
VQTDGSEMNLIAIEVEQWPVENKWHGETGKEVSPVVGNSGWSVEEGARGSDGSASGLLGGRRRGGRRRGRCTQCCSGVEGRCSDTVAALIQHREQQRGLRLRRWEKHRIAPVG